MGNAVLNPLGQIDTINLKKSISLRLSLGPVVSSLAAIWAMPFLSPLEDFIPEALLPLLMDSFMASGGDVLVLF